MRFFLGSKFLRRVLPLVVLGLVLGAHVMVRGASAAPQIASPQPEFNFGEVDNETLIKHDFVIMNVGSAPLEIKNVRTSCGCTVADPAKRVLAPGEQTELSATLNNRNRQGVQARDITVESNDPNQPHFRLRLTGTALAAITLDPAILNFGRIVDESPQSGKVTLTVAERLQPMRISSVESTLPEFEAELVTLEEGAKYEVQVRSNGTLASGMHNGQILIHQDREDAQPLMVNVQANVLGDYEVTPQQILLRPGTNPGETTSQYLRIVGGRVQGFQITEVIPPVDTINVNVRPQARDAFLIHLQDMPLDGSLDGKMLTIRTDNPDKPEVQVPFVVTRPGAVQRPHIHTGAAAQPQGAVTN